VLFFASRATSGQPRYSCRCCADWDCGCRPFRRRARRSTTFVCALVQRSAELLGGCGFSKTDALHALAPLMRSNLAHVIEHGAVSALTGPIERGDTQTVQKHLSCLTERDYRQLYALLGLEQVKMAQEKHPEQDYGTLAALLNREKEQNE